MDTRKDTKYCLDAWVGYTQGHEMSIRLEILNTRYVLLI